MIDEKVGTLRAQHEELGRAVTEIIANYVATLDARKVTSPAGPQELERMFAEPFPEQATAASDILNRFRDEVLEHAMQVPSPRYFGQFNPTPLPIGVWADALASVLNQNAGAWRNGPTSAVIEARVMRWLCELIGYESKSFGTLASGGTEANLIALKCARDNAHATGVQDGLRTAAANLVVYASEQVHFSVERSVDILGLGRASLRKIKTAPNFHVDTNQLRAQIETDIKAGFRPCCVVGLAGATSTGVIDPLEDLAQIAADYSCWYHIDAAYGGTLAFSEKHRHKLRGIERANSVTLDPHKWMFVPFACGALLVRDGGGVLRD
ncbi:MAG TPA: aminotransferase class I/II-fold pyridoxal phosphate-dependent enzyme, partial [Pyrinomonadaceae bacterium]|nr:aminotransferase class I/II-fold pyridoxal phosphate-dependent enzyme [Pyrinomonadaceae bacterium]